MKIIAETAFNHNGDLSYLKELSLAAKEAGADYVTVQIMDPSKFCVQDYERFKIYQENSFTKEEWISYFDFVKKHKLELIPCVLDEGSFLICYDYGYQFIKLHATDILNEPFLKLISKHREVKILLETQCATLADINYALRIIGGQVDVIIHGFSNYPTDYEHLNLNALDALKNEFPNLQIGFADHTLDTTTIPAMCLAKNIQFLEKHITLKRSNRNFDWQVSLEPDEFAVMVREIKKYKIALGMTFKHPIPVELSYRNVMYKKRWDDNQTILQRGDKGVDNLSYAIDTFEKANVGIAIVARLKSRRLALKVLKPILNSSLIKGLYERMCLSKRATNVTLITSWLEEDNDLVKYAEDNNIPVFKGHPESVIDRMLEYSIKNKLGGVFRVTGDNPLTSYETIDQMIDLFLENNLDYVRAIGLPFGVTAELFSTKYLWELYFKIRNPMESEYLSWFVLKDETVKRGYIQYDLDEKYCKVNLSVDLPEDYDRVIDLVQKTGKKELKDITLEDILKYANLQDLADLQKKIKLPGGKNIPYQEYIDDTNNALCITKKLIS